MIKAVLFDLDNTLIDVYRQKIECVKAAVKAMINAGLQMSEIEAFNEIMKYYKRTKYEDPFVFEHFMKGKHGVIDYKIVSAGIVAYRKLANDLLIPYQGVEETLTSLMNKGILLGIVTDAPRIKAWIRLTTAGLSEYFDIVLTIADYKIRKPYKIAFNKALKKLEITPNEALFVGDNLERDIAGGNIAGMKTAYAKYGSFIKDKPENKDEIPTYTLNEFRDLLKIV